MTSDICGCGLILIFYDLNIICFRYMTCEVLKHKYQKGNMQTEGGGGVYVHEGSRYLFNKVISKILD